VKIKLQGIRSSPVQKKQRRTGSLTERKQKKENKRKKAQKKN